MGWSTPGIEKETVSRSAGAIPRRPFLQSRRLDAAVRALEEAGTREILAGHCTGEKAVRYLAAHSKAKVDALHIGFESRHAGSSKR